MMRAVVLLAACITTLASPRPSRACSCARSQLTVVPGEGIEAPLNTQVRVVWTVSRYEKKFDEQSLALVDKNGVAVAVDRRAWTSGAVRTVLFTPKQALAAKTTYEVRSDGGKTIVGTFTTGSARDDTPPTWKGIVKAEALMRRAVCCTCGTGEAYARIDVEGGETGVRDDHTPADSIAFAIWPAKGKLDAASLLAIVPAWHGGLALGHPSICSPNNFTLAGKLAVRIAPIDLAGNVGDPADVNVDLANPTTD
jgi:hypothetical protein